MAVAGLLVAVLALSAAIEQFRVHAISGRGAAGLIRGIDPCPPDRACAISAQPSAQMWEATYLAFPDYSQTSATVVFDARTGLSYSQSMLLRSGDIVIRLTVLRDQGSVPRPMVVDVTAASTDGIVVTSSPADGSTDRIATATLSGPQDALLPVDAAIAWASTVDLFGDAPR